MNIGVIGTGNVGATLGRLWVKAGHRVIFGSQHPEKAAQLVNELGASASSQDTEEAVRNASVVVIAVPFKAWPHLASQIAPIIGTRPVIDTTNFNRERDGEIADRAQKHAGGTLGFISELLPNAKLVKSLNTLQASFLGERSGENYAVPLAGDDASAIETVATLVRDAGFDPVIVGKADRAKDFDNEKPVWNHPMEAAAMREQLEL